MPHDSTGLFDYFKPFVTIESGFKRRQFADYKYWDTDEKSIDNVVCDFCEIVAFFSVIGSELYIM